MSEYQFYEFAAVNGPISDTGLKYARSCSTRAEVTPFRWRNVYNWGDFHGSVTTLLQYYDAHLYLANWGTFRFGLSFPEGCLDLDQLEPYLRGNAPDEQTLSVQRGKRRSIVWWERMEEGGWGWTEGEGVLDRLLGIREELLCGDSRALCLGWLADFWPEDWDDLRDADVELPPLSPGLDRLSPHLRTLVEWTAVDPDVLSAAAALCAGEMPGRIPIEQVLADMPAREMKTLLARVAEGDGARVTAELNRLTYPRVSADTVVSPKCSELAAKALTVRDARLQQEAREREAKRKREEAARRQHLESVMKRADSIWSSLTPLMERRIASTYDAAAAKLTELRDAYLQAGREADFGEKLTEFRNLYGRRPAMMRRIQEL